MIKDYQSSELSAWNLVGREALAVTAAGLLYPFGLMRSKKRTPRQASQNTVVLIHGYMGNSSNFLPLKGYLRAKSITSQVLSFSYGPANGIEKSARELKEFLSRNVRGGTIDLVCHSLGGLVARVYLQDLGGARRVERCITLATPHKGTYNAYWFTSRVGNELRPNSELLQRIERSEKQASKVRFTSIVAGSDNIILPRIFAANQETVHVSDLGHIGILFSPTVFHTIAKYLKA